MIDPNFTFTATTTPKLTISDYSGHIGHIDLPMDLQVEMMAMFLSDPKSPDTFAEYMMQTARQYMAFLQVQSVKGKPFHGLC